MVAVSAMATPMRSARHRGRRAARPFPGLATDERRHRQMFGSARLLRPELYDDPRSANVGNLRQIIVDLRKKLSGATSEYEIRLHKRYVPDESAGKDASKEQVLITWYALEKSASAKH